MSKPVEHNGEWWLQQPDGSWSKWNGNTNSWEPYAPVGAEQTAAPASHQPAQQPPAQWPPQPGAQTPGQASPSPSQPPGASFGARAWGRFRSLPLWVQILIGLIVFSVIAAPFTQEEPEDTSAVGVETDDEGAETVEEEEEPAPPEEQPRFRGRLTDYYVINPATLGAYLKVTNTGEASGKWECMVSADDESGTYSGFDLFSANKVLKAGDAIGGRITLTITNEGARFVTQTDVDCDPQ